MIYPFTHRRVLGRASSYRALGLALAGYGALSATVPAQAQSVTPQSAPTVGTTTTTSDNGFTPPTNLDLGAVLSTGTGDAAASRPRRAPRPITRRH